jgi:SHS2 domain-containing protein
MSFELFEHKADIGVRGIGKTKEEAFCECAHAMFEAMLDTKSVMPLKSAKVDAKAADLSALLINYLNELLFLKDTKGMAYSKFRVKIRQVEEVSASGAKGLAFVLEGVVFGEKINSKRHGLKTDAKAATYSQMLVEKRADGKWVAQCIIDV